jgi:hypothetical protein
MVNSSRFMVRFPGQKTWIGMTTLDTKKLKPTTMIEIKDISCGNNHRSQEYSPKIGRIPLELARLKYSIDI